MDLILADLSSLRPLVWLFGTALVVGIAGHFLLFRVLLNVTKHTEVTFDNALVKRCYRPFQWIIIILIVRIVSKRPPDLKPLLPGLVRIAHARGIHPTRIRRPHPIPRVDLRPRVLIRQPLGRDFSCRIIDEHAVARAHEKHSIKGMFVAEVVINLGDAGINCVLARKRSVDKQPV